MNLRILDYNGRGLNDAHKVDLLRNYIQELDESADLILLQERKSHRNKAQKLCKLWPTRWSWTIEAEIGYNVDGTEGAGKGGFKGL